MLRRLVFAAPPLVGLLAKAAQSSARAQRGGLRASSSFPCGCTAPTEPRRFASTSGGPWAGEGSAPRLPAAGNSASCRPRVRRSKKTGVARPRPLPAGSCIAGEGSAAVVPPVEREQMAAPLVAPPMPDCVAPPPHAAVAALDEQSFFESMTDDGSRAPRSFTESTLVYNALTGRMISESSLSMTILKSIGFGIDAQRHLCVVCPEEINRLAERLRTGAQTLPARWPATLKRTLGGILKNPVIANPAQAVTQMMQIKLSSILRSRYTSVVTASGDTPGYAEDVDVAQSLDSAADMIQNIVLNAEQERVIDIALQGHHMYIGGSAGTGKTVLLRVLSRRLQAHRLRVAMTATTGVAGCHIGGTTFHHALGVSSHGEFLRRSTILDYDVIIIDEVSMLPQRLFEAFDRVLREEAGTPDLPFGGVQIILCGDFLQLGCIHEASIVHSKLFRNSFVQLRLQTQVRQSAFPQFAKDLQLMRLGIVPPELASTVQQLPPGTMVDSAVNLLPTNKEVHAANEKELSRLEGDPLTLTPETGITSLKWDTTATLVLRTRREGFNEAEFARHVRSLLQATLDLPRASLLSLYRIYEDGHAMRVVLPPGESVAWREAMRERFLEVAGLINDLDLGATVTEIIPSGNGLHTPEDEEHLQKLMAKHPIAQPLTFKKGCRVLLRANLSTSLVNGSIGTVVDFAECRPQSFAPFLRNAIVDECIERYRIYCFTECGMPIPMVPVVKFHSGETVAVPPWEFNVGGTPFTHHYSLSIVALPLSLAYAFTVHKVQGLTLVGRVHLELSRMWPCEHLLYVAMSRVRDPDQLSISSFTPDMIVANPDCVAFDNSLTSAEALTAEQLRRYPVSSWKRCNDTIYHLRRRGASLRRLLEDATLSNAARVGGASPPPSSALHTRSAAERGGVATGRPGAGGDTSPHMDYLVSVEHSVVVARRMRKLLKHAERVAKISETRRKAQATVLAAAPPAGGDGAMEAVETLAPADSREKNDSPSTSSAVVDVNELSF